MMPAVLTCIVGKRLGSAGEDHWKLREYAAKLMAEICRKHANAYPTLQPRVTKTLVRAVLDPLKPLATQYGSILGISELGNEPIKQLLIPNLKQIGNIVREGKKADESASNRVFDKLANVCAPLLKDMIDLSGSHQDILHDLTARFGQDLANALQPLLK
jgi:transcription initiation factor TFIID subunit 6